MKAFLLLLLCSLFSTVGCQNQYATYQGTSCTTRYWDEKCGAFRSCQRSACNSEGYASCRCPGNGQTIHIRVACHGSPGQCVPIHGYAQCGTYTDCAVCRHNIGESEGGCASCRTGFHMSSQRCYDTNECSNKPCEHTCTNTIGSYYCSCSTGYFLRADKHTCQKLSCGSPGGIADGKVLATDNFLFGSYIYHECNNHQILVGNYVRKCLPSTVNKATVSWSGSMPSCLDSCANLKTLRRCGPVAVTADQCRQLGCCYQSESKECYFRQERSSLVYRGEQVRSTVGIRSTLSEYSSGGCGISCLNSAWCKAFLIGRKSPDSVPHQDCVLLDQSRPQLIQGGNLVIGNQDYDFHEPILPSSATPAALEIDYSKQYIGCYSHTPGLRYFVWSSSATNSQHACLTTCRQQGFTIAGLKVTPETLTVECYCDVVESLSYRNTSSQECKSPCPGDKRMTCGGHPTVSVYRVPSDSRYIGCFADQSGEPNGRPILWTMTKNHSASRCVDDCLGRGYKYAAMLNASQCSCSNVFGNRTVQQPYDRCRMQCSVKTHESCGGPSAFALYATELGDVLLPNYANKLSVRHVYYSENSRLFDVPWQLFTELPLLKSITTPRFILRATDSVVTPYEDSICNANCYKLCGDISNTPTSGFENKGADQIIRLFHLNLAHLNQYVGKDARRVFVYAQTVVINTNLQFAYSLQVYTRQLILDRSHARSITVNPNSPTFAVEPKEPKTFGVTPDSVFLKQSLMCARILLDTRQQDNINTGWAILHDLARNQPSSTVETSAWLKAVHVFNGFLAGIDRQNVHFVPFYSKEYFNKQLALYFERIKLYKNDYDKMLDKTLSAAEYVKNTEEMVTIYSTTSVLEAKSAYDSSLIAIQRSTSTYNRLESDYSKAAGKVAQLGEAFGVDSKQKRSLMAEVAVKGFVKVVSSIATRNKMEDAQAEAEAAAAQLQKQLNIQLKNFAEGVAMTEKTVEQLYEFMSLAKDIAKELHKNDTNYDFSGYMNDIETAGQMKSSAVHWKTLRNNAHVVMSHPNVYKVKDCVEYMRAAMDMCDWGEALSNSVVEHSELLRGAIQQRYTLITKQQEAQRYSNYIDRLKKDQLSRELMTVAMEEQLQDVRIDLNNVLFSYCQAYFYENMAECKQEYKPAFGGSLGTLLLKINNVLQGSLSISAMPSSVSRRILITDRHSENNTCDNAMNCPVMTFKETGVTRFTLPVDHRGFYDLSRYRVSEILLDFIGAKSGVTTQNDILKVAIESSGIFYGNEGNNTYSFITTPLSLTYEYEIETNYVSIRADVYPPYRSIVQHITPFTTWILRLSELSRDIDLSALTSIRMRFLGSASANTAVAQVQQVLDAGIVDQLG